MDRESRFAFRVLRVSRLCALRLCSEFCCSVVGVGWLLAVPSRVYVFDLHFTNTLKLLAGYPYFSR